MSVDTEILAMLREMKKEGGLHAAVRTLEKEMVSFVAHQTEINKHISQLMGEVFGNGKNGLKQDVRDVQHGLDTLQDDMKSGFTRLGESVDCLKKERKEVDESLEKKLKDQAEKNLTWKWIREKLGVPLLLVLLNFLMLYAMNKMFP
ncbi:MAG: hypothetical protein JEZ06_00530 [Anaerolineaceae bacterium]|nr:hypothetical protein [Anaerolineaceae bacterium]